MKLLKRATVQKVQFFAGTGNTGLGTAWTVSIAVGNAAFTGGSSTVTENGSGYYTILTSVFDVATAGELTFKLVSGAVTVFVECLIGYLDDVSNFLALIDGKLGDGNDDLADEIAAVQLDTAALLLKAEPVLQFATERPQLTRQKIEVVRGDSYTGTIRNDKFRWTVRTRTNISSGTAYFTCKDATLTTQYWSVSTTPVLKSTEDDGTFVFELAFPLLSSESDNVTASEKPPRFDVTVELGTDRDTPYSGVVEVIEQVRS